jgi:hypothetical protein
MTRTYDYYQNPDSTGRMRRYRTHWDAWRTPYGPVDVELASPAPADPPVSRGGRRAGQAEWALTGRSPVSYRVRPTGHGPAAWRVITMGPGLPFGETAGAAAYGQAG